MALSPACAAPHGAMHALDEHLRPQVHAHPRAGRFRCDAPPRAIPRETCWPGVDCVVGGVEPAGGVGYSVAEAEELAKGSGERGGEEGAAEGSVEGASLRDMACSEV